MISTHQQTNICHNCEYKMDFLRKLDFCIQETVLYLDAYPDCRQALEYYHKLLEQRKEAMETYEAKCGPITQYGNQSKTSWDWTQKPWPWEPEAN